MWRLPGRSRGSENPGAPTSAPIPAPRAAARAVSEHRLDFPSCMDGTPDPPPPCAPLYPYHSRHCLLIKDHLMVCQTQRKWQVLINVQELPCATSHPVFSAFPWSPLPSPLPGPPDPASASVEANTKETSVRPGLTCSPPSGVPPQPFSPSPGSLSPGAGPSPSLTKGGHHERS